MWCIRSFSNIFAKIVPLQGAAPPWGRCRRRRPGIFRNLFENEEYVQGISAICEILLSNWRIYQSDKTPGLCMGRTLLTFGTFDCEICFGTTYARLLGGGLCTALLRVAGDGSPHSRITRHTSAVSRATDSRNDSATAHLSLKDREIWNSNVRICKAHPLA